MASRVILISFLTAFLAALVLVNCSLEDTLAEVLGDDFEVLNVGNTSVLEIKNDNGTVSNTDNSTDSSNRVQDAANDTSTSINMENTTFSSTLSIETTTLIETSELPKSSNAQSSSVTFVSYEGTTEYLSTQFQETSTQNSSSNASPNVGTENSTIFTDSTTASESSTTSSSSTQNTNDPRKSSVATESTPSNTGFTTLVPDDGLTPQYEPHMSTGNMDTEDDSEYTEAEELLIDSILSDIRKVLRQRIDLD